MKTILVAINSLVTTTHPAYSNHIQLFFRFGRSYPDYDFMLFNPARMSIDRMRNTAARIAIENECEYLLFIDDDVLVPINSLKQMLASNSDIVAGNVIIRGYPFENMFFRYTEEEKLHLKPVKDCDLPEVPGLMDVDAVGFSLCLIKTALLKELPIPYFVTGLTNTEDIYFCLKVKKYFPATTMRVDTSIVCHHILWAETISNDNKQAYKTYYETMHPQKCIPIPESVSADRGVSYYSEINTLRGITSDKT
jgi:hypothetical protein